ncbi:MAG: PDGLE domain-containing protein [Solirubrobacteraceae bacterium]|nr:PDGLE domain-containing protein [Solirubrobacteraceae bacterium]
MSRVPLKLFTIVGLAVAVGLATAVSPFAASTPDGLERVAEDKAFVEAAKDTPLHESSPIPDYAFPGIDDERVATGVAGFVGTLFMFGLGYGLALLIRRRDGGGGATTA